MRDTDLLTVSDTLWARIAELEAENQRLRDAAWAMVEKEAAKHLPAYEKQHKRIAELEAENQRLKTENRRLDKENNILRETVQPRTEQVIEWAAKYERLRDAVLNLPVEEMAYEHHGGPVLAGYFMQCQGEWDAVKALLRSE